MNIQLDPETQVITILSGYARELKEGNDYLQTTYQTAARIVKIFDPLDTQKENIGKLRYPNCKSYDTIYEPEYNPLVLCYDCSHIWKP
jgi:hypothetical protein